MIMISYFCIPLLHLYSKPKCDFCKLVSLLGGGHYKKPLLAAGCDARCRCRCPPPTASTKQWCQESGWSGSSCHNSAGVPSSALLLFRCVTHCLECHCATLCVYFTPADGVRFIIAPWLGVRTPAIQSSIQFQIYFGQEIESTLNLVFS